MNLASKTVRRGLPVGPKLHVVPLFNGLHIGYRKNASGATWTARRHLGNSKYEFWPLGNADDAKPADGLQTLSFDQASDKARQDALRKAQEASGEIVGGSYTVEQAMADYIKEKARELKCKPDDPKLARAQTTIDAFILPTLGSIQLAKLTHTTVKKWRDALADSAPRVRTREGREQVYRKIDQNDPDAVRARQASVNRVLTVIKAALNHAKAQKRVVSDSAWVDVKPFRKVDVAKIRFLTVDEVTALVAACSPDFQKLAKGGLLTGCRYGELCNMGVADFNAKDGNVYVAKSKNGESRYVDLNDAGIAFFTQIVEGRKPTEKMFLRANGKQWQESEQQRPMEAACEVAKIEGCTMHILRHTYASHAIMDGMPIEVLSKQLGHKDLRITMKHYAHLCKTFKQTLVMKHAPSFGFAS
jgi:integrase